MGGILFSYIPWKVSLSGEVGGYPQALLKVVNLQVMLNFHRNFHLMKRVKIVVYCRGVFKGMHAMVWSELKRKYKNGRAGHQEKRYSLSILRDVSKLSVNSGDFGHNILSPKRL